MRRECGAASNTHANKQTYIRTYNAVRVPSTRNLSTVVATGQRRDQVRRASARGAKSSASNLVRLSGRKAHKGMDRTWAFPNTQIKGNLNQSRPFFQVSKGTNPAYFE